MPRKPAERVLRLELVAVDPPHAAGNDLDPTGTLRVEMKCRCGSWTRKDHPYCSACSHRLRPPEKHA